MMSRFTIFDFPATFHALMSLFNFPVLVLDKKRKRRRKNVSFLFNDCEHTKRAERVSVCSAIKCFFSWSSALISDNKMRFSSSSLSIVPQFFELSLTVFVRYLRS